MKIRIATGYEKLHEFVESLPQTFNDSGVTLYDARNVIKRFSVEGIDVVVKRYRRPHLLQRIVYTFFRKSKARRAFEYGAELLRRGIDTPVPMAYIETKSGGLLEYGYYLSAPDEAPAIQGELIEKEDFNRDMAHDFAVFAATLHERGILHGDLNSTNVLWHLQADGHYHFSVIDINRMKFYAKGQVPSQKEWMENLTRFCGRMDLFRYVAECYVAHRHLPAETIEQMVAQKNLHDERWRRRKSFFAKFKKQQINLKTTD